MAVRAAVLSIGDELTIGQVAERNAQQISHALLELGVIVDEHRCVGDDQAAIATALGELAVARNVVISTGGLGPTADDLTREALADAMGGVALEENDAERERLERRFASRGTAMPPINLRQALVPSGATAISNPNGTAPGLYAMVGGCLICCLPGPPAEMTPMLREAILPLIKAISKGEGAEGCSVWTVHSCGLSESEAAQRISALMARTSNPLVGTTASAAMVSARLRATGVAARDGSIQRVAAQVHEAWKPFVYGCNAETLEGAIGDCLSSSGEMVAVAESCTGGLLGGAMTSQGGSSRWFKGGWITYSNELKSSELGVSMDMINEHGAVSAQVAMAMALGAARRGNCRFGLSTTGIAGPTGGSDAKPVGSVFVGVADRAVPDSDGRVHARHFRFPGERDGVRQRAVRVALQVLRLHLVGESAAGMLWEVARDRSGP